MEIVTNQHVKESCLSKQNLKLHPFFFSKKIKLSTYFLKKMSANKEDMTKFFFLVEFGNGFGYNTTRSTLILALVKVPQNYDLTNLRQVSGAPTLTIGNSDAGRTLEIGFCDANKIDKIVQSALDCGFNLTTQNTFNVLFKAGDTFSALEMEKRAIQNFFRRLCLMSSSNIFDTRQDVDDLIENMDQDRGIVQLTFEQSLQHYKYVRHWLWNTQVGKKFAKKLGEIVQAKLDDADEHPRNYLMEHFHCIERKLGLQGYYRVEHTYDTCQRVNCDVRVNSENDRFHVRCHCSDEHQQRSLQDSLKSKSLISDDRKLKKRRLEAPKGAQVVDLTVSEESTVQEEPQLCLVCQEKQANTLVVPCNHVVACSDCSKKLETTNNSASCILCRTKIDSIFYDKGPVKHKK